ncbi:response regulator transcription factor [Chloroflexota bacterium]
MLIVDDSALIRDRLKDMLSELVEVEIAGEARDKSEAVDLTRKLNPDVVILDIRLLRGNGIEVLQEIKAGEPSPIILMLTNYPYPQYHVKCMAAGANFFFDKATEFVKVPEVLKQLISKA